MRIKNLVYIVDTHTEGEPTRVILGGFPKVNGQTVFEKRNFIAKNLDWLRTALLLEPRGHSNQFGATVLPTTCKTADYALVFMDAGGYLDMCGHATIGVTTALIETGIVEAMEPYTTLHYETVAGIITARARIINDSVEEVSIVDVPSFHLGSYDIRIAGGKSIPVDVAYGGNFCTIADAASLDTRVRTEEIYTLLNMGIMLRNETSSQIHVSHPDFPHDSKKIELAMITDEPELPNSSGKNIVIFGKGQFDRSPCATGTAARLATMYSRGSIQVNEPFVHESVINTVFKARIVDTTMIGSFEAVIPEITGSAYITQISNPVIHPNDPLRDGFTLFSGDA